MTKQELRVKYKLLRAAIDEEELEEMSMEIANRLLQLPIWQLSTYHLFLSIKKQKEINTEFILHILQGKDKNVVISKSDFELYTLSHILLTDNTVMKVNKWGIPEPVDGIKMDERQLEVVFVPLLVFDEQGNRIGYGKGFYDRFLASCNSETIKIGLSVFPAEEIIEGVLPTDIRLDYCVTPEKIYQFEK
ncbi:5-formyltetrahydrofolate cyclo-ligase [Aquimarina sp. TRL1]|uniref:5-formyltetrahydrofolate cyclo-ligase n=1 Tax=Aquimarina sp. (strain TRL1) TaxID=2736252 RepID=UPI00158DD194|nr:5-formyltetrahydrofolate cyclo-ligase [Aquimarina sp. TRL1]QKX04548.1 5-formyltetrahydrofolate cyclo-ligase [Aquimarina sp. TRL1]